ncbi:histidine kinase [Crocosphaera watsonii]|uniref:Phytochrome, two-component sensor histidine kinase n=1 Tax=Crocosphaera watsonii WH 8502 TaxID=423474 RepID=T2IIG2_CROWT|nr:histidine kinase [Crocosphaera watsonii]CCQ52679.1 Phytochrome, two-component sensor histidine kinase [Crocosphaera watsonii WH 8502]
MRNLSLNDYKKYENFDFRYPGLIQPRGVLLVIDIKTFTIIQVSENTKRFLGVKPKTLLGKPLTYLMYLNKLKTSKIYLRIIIILWILLN